MTGCALGAKGNGSGIRRFSGAEASWYMKPKGKKL